MRRIWEELTGIEQSEESFEDTEEGRERLRELIKTLRKRCKALEEEIKYIKASFPYTAKTLLDDDNALEHTNQKFIRRFNYVEQHSIKVGKSLNDMTLEEMDELWNEAKKYEKE